MADDTQLLLFDSSQPGCAQCGEPMPAFEAKRYCSKVCLREYHRLLRAELRSSVDKTPTSLYKYFDHDDVLLYVGITSRGVARNTEHNKSKSWWQYVVRQTVEHHRNRKSAEEREAALIKKFAPPFNKRGNFDYKEANAAYLMKQSLGGAEGVKLLAEGKNRVAGLVVNKVGTRVTLMVPSPDVDFTDVKAIRVDSGGRQAVILDAGQFSDGTGSWVRVKSPKPEQVSGAIVMYKHTPNSALLPAKMIKLVYREDGLVNVWDRHRKGGGI